MSFTGAALAIVLYVDNACPYCIRAQQLFDELNVTYKSIDVRASENHAIWEQIKKDTGRKTVPQIYINNNHIGGCDDLYALHHSGNLSKLLEKE